MDVLADLREHYDFTVEHLQLLKFDRKCMADRNTIAMYISVIELADAVHILCKNNSITGLGPVFRTLLEAFVELINVTDDESYVYRMEAADAEGWLKLLNEAAKGTNEYVASISKDSNFEKERQGYQDRIKELQDQKLGALSIADRFIRAGMEDEYRALYNGFSAEGHNNIRALLSRHIEIDHETNDFQIVFRKNEHDGEHDHKITTTSNFLLKAGIRLHEKYKTSALTAFQERFEAFIENESKHFA